jgi:hypothetical protein
MVSPSGPSVVDEQLTVLAREELAHGLHSRPYQRQQEYGRPARGTLKLWDLLPLVGRVSRSCARLGVSRRRRWHAGPGSVSLLSKIEIGDRTLTPGIAAAIASALQISLGALYGEAAVAEDQGVLLENLRTAVRRYDIPDQVSVPELAQLRVDLNHALNLREQTDLAGLLRMLPGLLSRATTYAHAAASSEGWALLAEVYSVVYWLAARHRWMDLVEVAPTRQA